MNSLVEKIMNVDKSVRELYGTMIEMLNQDDMDYKIEFRNRVWDFSFPLSREEKDLFEEGKREVTSILLEDAFDRMMDTITFSEGTEESRLRYVWINIANLQRATQKGQVISTIVSSESYSVDEGSSKDLDYESIYIQAQRKDLSDEEKWNILLHDFVDKEPMVQEPEQG